MTTLSKLPWWGLATVVILAAVSCATPPKIDDGPPPSGLRNQPAIAADAGAGYPFPSPTALASSIVYYASAGNSDGTSPVPSQGAAEDVSTPTHVIGTGTPESCTVDALASAVRGGGVITFDCGPLPTTITLDRTLVACNTTTCAHPWQGGTPVAKVVIDGGGLVTLSGNDQRGIFYSNTCEEEFGWLTDRCDLQTTPLVVFQNIALEHGNATTGPAGYDGVGGGGGGGAIAMRGGQFKAVNVTFAHNRCMERDSDGGGGAVRLVGQQATAYLVSSTFESNQCANGGAISGLGTSIRVINSLVTNNTATGTGASSGQGGNGGGMYGDGNSFHFGVEGTIIAGNFADEGGPGVFFVSNDRTGTLTITDSQIIDNTGENFHTSPYRDIFYLGGGFTVAGSTVQ
jgi:predicted outer membrane repeat protein